MKKDFVRGLTMVMLVAAIALTAAVASANAQSAKQIEAQVPFDFVVGNKTLSAGQYTLRSASALDSLLLVQKESRKSSAVRMTNAIASRKNKQAAKLVFHRYGQRYFLAEVWNGTGNEGRQLLKSRHERAIEREFRTLAANGDSHEESCGIVEVAAVHR